MAAAVLMVLAGLVVLPLGADQMVIGAGRLSTRLGVPPVIVGVVVIGFGTSAPELLVSTIAATSGHGSLAVGNIVGSNVLNVTLILGLAGLVAPFTVRSGILRREAPLSVGAVAVFALLLFTGLNAVAGVTLMVLLAAAMLVLRQITRAGDPDLPNEVTQFLNGAGAHRLPRETLRTAGGLAVTLVGAQLLVAGASSIAASLGVSQATIGFVLVSFGTSLPELITTVQGQRRGETELIVGNLLGSNLFNSLGVGAATGLTVHTAPTISDTLIAIMVAASVLAWLLLIRGHRLTRPEAGLLLLAYAATLPLLTT